MKIAYIIMQFFFKSISKRSQHISQGRPIIIQRKFTTENWLQKNKKSETTQRLVTARSVYDF